MDSLGRRRKFGDITSSTAQVQKAHHTTTDSYADANINGDLAIEYCPSHPRLRQCSHDVRTGSATPSQATVRTRAKPFMLNWLRERV